MVRKTLESRFKPTEENTDFSGLVEQIQTREGIKSPLDATDIAASRRPDYGAKVMLPARSVAAGHFYKEPGVPRQLPHEPMEWFPVSYGSDRKGYRH